jgi:hypothetical protein
VNSPADLPTRPRLDAAVLAATLGAMQIATTLETVGSLVYSDRFLIADDALDDVLGLMAGALHEWTRALTNDPDTWQLRVDARVLFERIRSGTEVWDLAKSARDWANDVMLWARLSRGAS